jgi:phosphopantothenoylcysteine decarboxylase/phosphopantothenate--cysteine ligase
VQAPDNTALNASTLNGLKVVLGVSGGIAAYKSAYLVRLLKKAGADVQVLMTRDAARFVTRLTLSTLSGREVLIDVFPDRVAGDGGTTSWTKHIELGTEASVFIVAPATAQTIARLANGFCDNMLTAVALAARCPILVCPAMDHDMYIHPATKANLERLRGWGYHVLSPEFGELASGLIGEGRLPEPETIVAAATSIAASSARRRSDLAGKHVLVTAGPTREAVDPVRYLSNRSSGRMGFAVARAAARRGARVTLVSGPTLIESPPGVQLERVTTAAEMYEAVLRHADADVVVAAAAVSDYAPTIVSDQKLKKDDGLRTIALEPTVDILADVGGRKRMDQVLIGFALETHDEMANARRKLEAKNLDWIVVNNPLVEGAGFEGDTNRVTLLSADGDTIELPLLTKDEVADAILDRVSVR